MIHFNELFANITGLSTAVSVLEASLRMATPLMFAALGGFLCERSGVINIALEGLMIIGACFGAITALATHSPWLGLVGAMLASSAVSAILALLTIEFRANQIVTCVALNILCAGIPPFLLKIIYDVSGATPSLTMNERFQHNELSILAWLLALIVTWVWAQTPAGLALVAAGDNPEALRASGLSARTVRWVAVLTSGLLAGLGGATLSLSLASFFSRDMTAGRGFMAVAALIFGKWRPLPTIGACVLFGLTDALQIRLQGLKLGATVVPTPLMQILPYLVTLFVLAGFIGKARPPRDLGQPLPEN